VRPLGPHIAKDLEAVLRGKHQVEQDGVVAGAAEAVYGLVAVFDEIVLVSAPPQQGCDEGADSGVVIDDENARALRGVQGVAIKNGTPPSVCTVA